MCSIVSRSSVQNAQKGVAASSAIVFKFRVAGTVSLMGVEFVFVLAAFGQLFE